MQIKKKICIISSVDMSRMTILSIYTEYLTKCGYEFDIICAKKKAENICPTARNIYEFDANKTAESHSLFKILHFLRMRNLVKKVLSESKYDFIIVWNQVTAMLFADIFTKEYKGRYCVNVRDYIFDKLLPIRLITKKIYKNAAFNTISSDAFRRFLPNTGNFIMFHSFNAEMLSQIKPRETIREPGEPIRIMYIGQIGWLENVYALIDALGNDKRFELLFIGSGAENLSEYIEKKQINNVYIHGRFMPSQTVDFLKKADVIYNLYGYGNLHVDTALSIKLYYAVRLNIPILVYENTYMQEIAEQCGIGFVMHGMEFNGMADRLYKFYHERNLTDSKNKCEAYIECAIQSQKDLCMKLEKVLNAEKE